MKMKKSLLSVVFLLATSSAMAAMSYSSASVTSDMSVSLVDTNNALLALSASEVHNAAYLDGKTSKSLKLDLDKGYGNQDFGVQQDSTYKWNDLFMVTNNSENEVTVKVSLDPNVNEGRVQLFGSINGENWNRLSNIHEQNPGGPLTFVLPAGESSWVDIKSVASNGHVKTTSLDLLVEAE